MCKLKKKWRQTVTTGVKNEICFTPLNCVPYKRTTLNIDFDTNFIIFTRVWGNSGQKYVIFVKIYNAAKTENLKYHSKSLFWIC